MQPYQNNCKQSTSMPNMLPVLSDKSNDNIGIGCGEARGRTISFVDIGKTTLKQAEHPISNPWVDNFPKYVKTKSELIEHDLKQGLIRQPESLMSRYMKIIDANLKVDPK